MSRVQRPRGRNAEVAGVVVPVQPAKEEILRSLRKEKHWTTRLSSMLILRNPIKSGRRIEVNEMKRMVPFLSICIILILAVVQADAQNSQTTGPPPANLWMTYPVTWVPASDTVAVSIRQQRDQFFDDLIGLGVPLTPANAKSRAFSVGVPFPNQPEIPQLPNRTVVIGTFQSYQPVLSKSGRAIYTEVTLSLSNVFQDAAGDLGSSATLTLILNGGTVITQSGVVLSFLTNPAPYSIKPGRTYLFALSFYSNGGFYREGKSWDLSGGTVQTNSSFSAQTPSTLIGMSLQQLITVLNAQFGIE